MPRVVGEPAQIPHGRRALRLRIMCRIHRLTHELGGASRAGGGWQRYLKREVIERSSKVIRGHQRSSEVIRGHQRSSEVIRGPIGIENAQEGARRANQRAQSECTQRVLKGCKQGEIRGRIRGQAEGTQRAIRGHSEGTQRRRTCSDLWRLPCGASCLGFDLNGSAACSAFGMTSGLKRRVERSMGL